ncbi:MAG: dimethyl sulfoxide reductase anchor subunit [Bacteroidales bacterium]|nr:dimethyl sulfoxide reductase anchor subunit [Bacteroidales bacterium]MCF8337278.1 dimethyl sulfoxide reductase anchor subunit [Bacteroidales bacterium]
MHEWSLIVFTLLTQIAVGVFIAGGMMEWRMKSLNRESASTSQKQTLPVVIVLAVVALITSFLHLGSPGNALHALNNIASSWLSREILFVSLFTGGVIVFFLLTLWTTGSATFRKIVAYITAIAGLLAIFSMAKVYMLETVPVWNTVFTPLQFFFTSFLLGGLVVLVYNKNFEETTVRLPMKVLLVLVLASIVLWVANTYLVSGQGIAAGTSLEVLLVNNGWLYYGRLVLMALAVVLMVYPIIKRSIQEYPGLIITCFALLLIAEIIGRYLFYASYVRVGV